MKGRRARDFQKGGIDLAGEAIHLLRTAPPRVLAGYLLGTLPFALGALYFWADMSRSAFAHERCFGFSLGLAVLFVWMKAWHVAFADGLKAHITGTPAPPWTFRHWVRQAAVQTALQPYGLLLIPLSICLVVPFPAVHAFYQNLTALGSSGPDAPLRQRVRKAWRLANLWPRQNVFVIWLLSPWPLAIGMLAAFGGVELAMTLGSASTIEAMGLLPGVVLLILIGAFMILFSIAGGMIAANIGIILAALPELLRLLLGLDTRFSLGGPEAILNSTFALTVFALTALVMDPVLQAAHALRGFYGDAQTTGEDLLVELKELTTQAPSPSAPAEPARP